MPEQKQITVGDLKTIVVTSPGKKIRGAVILCHGFGASGSDLAGIGAQMMEFDPAFEEIAFFFPAAPLEIDPAWDGRAWWMLDMQRIEQLQATGDHRHLKQEQPPEIYTCAAMIEGLLDHITQEYSIETSAIIVGGFSQGAMLSTHVALSTDKTLGGLIIWSGALINAQEWEQLAAAKAPLTIVQSHGSADPILPFDNAKDLNAMFNDAGHEVTFLPFDGPHTIPGNALVAAATMIRSKVLA